MTVDDAAADDRIVRLRILATHHEEQLQGALCEARALGVLLERDSDTWPVVQLNAQIAHHESELAALEGALGPVPRRDDRL